MRKTEQLLDYVITHPGEIVTYQASNMVLVAHSDVFYLSETNARRVISHQSRNAR